MRGHTQEQHIIGKWSDHEKFISPFSFLRMHTAPFSFLTVLLGFKILWSYDVNWTFINYESYHYPHSFYTNDSRMRNNKNTQQFAACKKVFNYICTDDSHPSSSVLIRLVSLEEAIQRRGNPLERKASAIALNSKAMRWNSCPGSLPAQGQQWAPQLWDPWPHTRRTANPL